MVISRTDLFRVGGGVGGVGWAWFEGVGAGWAGGWTRSCVRFDSVRRLRTWGPFAQKVTSQLQNNPRKDPKATQGARRRPSLHYWLYVVNYNGYEHLAITSWTPGSSLLLRIHIILQWLWAFSSHEVSPPEVFTIVYLLQITMNAVFFFNELRSQNNTNNIDFTMNRIVFTMN